MNIFLCKNCNVQFKGYKIRGKDRLFCSAECRSKFYLIFKKCEFCGKTFKTFKYHDYRFCSQKCSNTKNMKEISKKTEKILCTCIECNKKWYMDACKKRAVEKKGSRVKFCSRKCYKKNREHKEKCLFCEKEYLSKRKRTKYCSRECSYDDRKSKNIPGFWNENGYRVLYTGNGKGTKEHIKIIEKVIGRKINTKLEVIHHKNFIRDDNRIENLHLMKRGEHSKLHRNLEKLAKEKNNTSLV